MDKMSFILDFYLSDNGVTANLFDADDAFGQPIASATAENANDAAAAVIASVHFSFMLET